MRRNNFQIAAGYILAVLTVLFVLTAGASASSGQVIYSFQGGSDGANPYSDLVMDAAGNLYGTTSQGGGTGCNGQGCGTVFELTPTKDGWKHQVLYAFTSCQNDGCTPQTGLIFDNAGNLYGTTTTVFELSPNGHGGWTENTLHVFAYGEGSNPAGDLIFDDKGNLYGANSAEGNGQCLEDNGCGTAFELTPQSDGTWSETTIHVFTDSGSDGAVPSSRLNFDSTGSAYGVTAYGGPASCTQGSPRGGGIITGCGTLYKLTPNQGGGWTESTLYDFVRGGGFGIYPSGGLFFDKAGHLYGTSQAGGNGYGTFFELRDSQENGWQQSDLHFFYGNPDGGYPVGRLVMDREGNVFGVTDWGGANRMGVVFELRRAKVRWNERILYNFPSSGGPISPQAGLVSGSQGHLYGTTRNGGSGNGTECNIGSFTGCGTVYEVTP